MDLDENKAIAAQYNVQSYPTLIYFIHGEVNKFGGSRNV